MRIGDIVAVDVGCGPSVMNYVGIVTRADSWNGIWVTSTRGFDGDVAELPLADFASGGKLVDRPDLEPLLASEAEAAEARSPRRPANPIATAVVVAVGAVATWLALRAFRLA
jgi:hypothetical protein